MTQQELAQSIECMRAIRDRRFTATALKKAQAYGDPRRLALTLVGQDLAAGKQPLVPEPVLTMGNGDSGDTLGLFGKLLTMLLAERGGVSFDTPAAAHAELEASAAVGRRRKADRARGRRRASCRPRGARLA